MVMKFLPLCTVVEGGFYVAITSVFLFILTRHYTKKEKVLKEEQNAAEM
jgi:hypothetical protein